MDLKPVADLIGKRFDVGNNGDLGWIELVDMLPHPLTHISADNAVVSAARVSYLGESKGPSKDKNLIYYLLEHGHSSPFEQVEFKFRVRAPMVTFWHWARHRTWNMNSQSGRYTPFEENEWHTPDANDWRRQSKTNHQGSNNETFTLDEQAEIIKDLITNDDILNQVDWYKLPRLNDDDSETFSNLLHMLQNMTFRVYDRMLKEGMAKEQARFYMPAWTSYYTWVLKIDASNLLKFIKLRMSNDAQYEIRAYAAVIWNEMFKVAMPWTAEAAEEFGIVVPLDKE